MNALQLECFSTSFKKIAKATPKFRVVQRKPGACKVVKFEGGVEVSVAEVSVEQPSALNEKAAAPSNENGVPSSSGVRVAVGDSVQFFSSTRVASRALGLPDNKHVKFRAEMKKAGSKVFELNDQKFIFSTL